MVCLLEVVSRSSASTDEDGWRLGSQVLGRSQVTKNCIRPSEGFKARSVIFYVLMGQEP
jgi:hypothetical protein